jgi:PAS domain-containing protein
MYSAASEQETSGWLVKDGSKELELLLWAVLSHQSDPILIADDSGQCVEASAGAAKLLGVSMGKMIGESIEHLLQPSKLPQHANEGSVARVVMSCRSTTIPARRRPTPTARTTRSFTGFRPQDCSLVRGSRTRLWLHQRSNHRSTCQLPLSG